MFLSALRLGLATVVFASSVLSQAITNPGFETGDEFTFPSGWTSYSGGGVILGSQYGPHSGSQDFAHASPATFGQTVTGLSDGVAYDLSFFARRDSSSATLSVSVDDGTPVNIILASGYTLQTVRFVPGGSGESTFKLTGNGDKNNIYYDDFAISASSTTSGSPERRRKRAVQLEREQLLLSNPYCPARLTACPVKSVAPGDEVDLERDGYECLDTQTEYESCGGCATTGEGVDCSDLADRGARPDSITCSAGRCVVYKCQPGFALLADGSGCKAIIGRVLRY